MKASAGVPLIRLASIAEKIGKTMLAAPSEAELSWMKEILCYQDLTQEMFHGGIAGLSVGDTLLPGLTTGSDNFGDPAWKRDFVYASRKRSVADYYANLIQGSVYRVKLNGEIGLDMKDLRILSLLLTSPQMKQAKKEFGEAFYHDYIGWFQAAFIARSATILEVLA